LLFAVVSSAVATAGNNQHECYGKSGDDGKSFHQANCATNAIDMTLVFAHVAGTAAESPVPCKYVAEAL
jgi:hypothetical protein